MALIGSDYLAQLQALLPPGPAWPRAEDAPLTKILAGLAEELARVDGRAMRLVIEADPRTTSELFAEWERVAGLPDECVVAFDDQQSAEQRRAALIGRLVSAGGQSAAYYIAVAEALGYEISIREFRRHTVNSDVNYPLYGSGWAFTWEVTAPLTTVRNITVNSTVNEPIAVWGNGLLECVLERLKPAHTRIVFRYV